MASLRFSPHFGRFGVGSALTKGRRAPKHGLAALSGHFAVQEHFIFRTVLSPNCNAIWTFGPFCRCQGTLSLQQFKGCRSQPPPPPKRFRRRLSASRSFAPASRPNRAAVFATPHARELAHPSIRRFVSPFVSESETFKKQQAHQAPLSAKACLCTRAHAFLRRNGNTLHRCEAFTNARTGRPSASISTTIGARSKSFRPPTQKQAASVPRADRTASIHRATSRQCQRTFAVGGTFRPQSSIFQAQIRLYQSHF